MKTLVLIDDNENDLDLALKVLCRMEQKIDCFAFLDSDKAIDSITFDLKTAPDYILIDVNMPSIDGKDCLRYLKTLQRLKHTKFIVHSGFMPIDKQHEFIDLGATYTFQKPFTIASYKRIFETILLNEYFPN